MAEICFKLIHITDIQRLIGGHHLPTASDDLAVEADRWRHEESYRKIKIPGSLQE